VPTPERKRELEERYFAELIKVGFSETQAHEIVAEAADRLGADEDGTPAPDWMLRRKPSIRRLPETTTRERAVKVIAIKEAQPQPARITWNTLKRAHSTIKPGGNFMQAMQEAMASEMKRLEFTEDDISFILGVSDGS
jgi:hypothetical protein